MYKTTYVVKGMDCHKEEQLIKTGVKEIPTVLGVRTDLSKRTVEVYHRDSYEVVSKFMSGLRLDAKFVSSEKVESIKLDNGDETTQRKVLWQVLIINFFFFLLELITGLLAESMGLIADSLDMLADSFVYGISLFVVGKSTVKKKRVAAISGYFQFFLAVLGLFEVIRRFLGYGENPDFKLMIIISFFALVGNTVSLFILERSKSKEAHIQASMIFTSNDMIANSGVIIAGIFVYFIKSRIPDLIIGAIVFFIVANGALKIIKLSK